jgi:UDP-glucose 4-epimerase
VRPLKIKYATASAGQGGAKMSKKSAEGRKVLLTGAFGNIGICALEELLKAGHEVRCFDLETKANIKTAKNFEGKAEIVWGNIFSFVDVIKAVAGRDVVVHLAAIIPPASEVNPGLARKVNAEGTHNLLNAMRSVVLEPKIIFASSVSVFGNTQGLPPPRKVSDAVIPSDYYTSSKIWCEKEIQASGLAWSILRLGAALSPKISLKNAEQFRMMFQIPLENRIEFLHPRDAGLALANAAGSEKIWGKILLIGGGKNCQLYWRYAVRRMLDEIGIGMLPKKIFSKNPYYTDWVDTEESQKLLNYQRHSFDDFIDEMVKNLGWKRGFVKLFRPIIRKWILSQSPYCKS